MSRNGWRLDAYAFTVILETLGRDRLPYPLVCQPEGLDHDDDWQKLRLRAVSQLYEVLDQDLYTALGVLLEPEIRIEIFGSYGPGKSQILRMHAGLTPQAGTLAVQLPGPNPEYGGDVLLLRGSAAALPGAIVANLPKFPAGTHGEFAGNRGDLDRSVYARHPMQLSEAERLQRFFRRSRAGFGEVDVYPGAALDWRPSDAGSGFFFLDYPGDGRYLLHNRDAERFEVTPGPDAEIVRQLERYIATV